MGTTKTTNGFSAVELLSLVGFSFLIAWTFVSFFWVFCDYPVGAPIQVQDFSQLFIFLGVAVGYVILHFLGRSSRFNLFSMVVVGAEILFALGLPFVAFSMYGGLYVPLWVVCTANLMAGIASAFLITSWLDVLSRLKTKQYGRFTGIGFVGGSLLFAFAAVMPDNMQSIFSFAYLLFSVCLLVFCTQNADGNDERAPLESTESAWKFTKEIEPSFFVFNIVFALNFVFLFNSGSEALLPGLLCALPGGLLIALLSIKQRMVDITVVQRVLLVVTVLACVMMPFTDGWVQIACACLVVAAWAAFRAVNYGFVVRKSVLYRSSPLFRQAPLRLVVSASGFAVGWMIAVIVTAVAGPHSEPFVAVRLVMAVVLVVVVMAFYPVGKHHPVDGSAEEGIAHDDDRIAVSMNESELLERRCQAIAKLYQLSPRESDVLIYLARGRNASWIQEELVISPHTAKSHIYNIYRKLDIHSQQKLMSFVEEFPID